MTTTTHIAHFTVSGEGLTQIVRNFMLDEEPAKAWRIVAQCVHTSNSENAEKYAADILDGKKWLVGEDPHITIENDPDSESYVKDLTYIYAGRVKVHGRWYRPAARVDNFGPEDMRGNSVAVTSLGKYKLALARISHYCLGDEKVFETLYRENTEDKPTLQWIIFEPCSEPPHWWNPIQLRDSYLSCEKVGRDLDVRGHAQWYPKFEEPELPPTVEGVISQMRYAEDLKVDEILGESYESKMDRRETEREEAYLRHITEIKIKVLEQAAGDMMELKNEADEVIAIVPRAPFAKWALSRTSLKHLAPPWNTISPTGMKLSIDNPDHTDWWIGAGLEIDDYMSHPAYSAGNHMMFELQEQLGNFECGVIVGGKLVSGEVGKNIAVLPDLHPSRLDQLMNAEVVLTEAGGAMAHLAQIALERSIPILLVPDACKRLPIGTKLAIFPDTGSIVVKYERR